MQHRDPRGDVAQRNRQVEAALELLDGGEALAQHQPMVIDETDLLRRVLRAGIEQDRAQPDLQRPLGDTRGAVGRACRGEGGEREDERAAGRCERSDRASVRHDGAGY